MQPIQLLSIPDTYYCIRFPALEDNLIDRREQRKLCYFALGLEKGVHFMRCCSAL